MHTTIKTLFHENKTYYDTHADLYEHSSWYYFNRYKSKAVDDELVFCLRQIGKNHMKVLELGPGTGYLASKLVRLSSMDITYTGIEHSSKMARILKRRLNGAFKAFSVISDSVSSDLIRQEIAGSFDLIMGSSILHHLPDYDDVIRELASKLKPGGVMYFVREPVHRHECEPANPVKDIFTLIYRKIDRILLKPAVKRALWPQKVKQPDPKAIAVHMFKNGISLKPFYRLSENGIRVLKIRKYNRSPSSLISFIQNQWFPLTRKDIFGNTLFSIVMRLDDENIICCP